ncbi:MAG TPA: MobF family relaxase [Tepidisphaeraceae bacterium]|jgi:conjugative relaxase-like TrwC/TraI family protein|nr:MobF family relaxase [Tepidisphaeraceae bacterium]
MIRMVVSSNAEGATRYFTEALSKGDYYTQGQEYVGSWHGKGAGQLGLTGSDFSGLVTPDQFRAMSQNRHPGKDEPLTERTVGNRRVGYDINFHAPKSISVLYGLTQDANILEAFRSSVQETMEQMEGEMKCRVRVGGAQHDRTVGNLCWAEFVHFTARPVDGYPDPHLHAHCFTFNAVWDGVEQKWKAGQFGDLKRDAPFFEASFHARLASKLVGLGYVVERRGKSWEIASVPEPVVRLFSRRTTEIEAKAKELGISDPVRKSQLGAKTRKRKNDAQPLPDLQRRWNALVHPNIKASFIKRPRGRGSFGQGIERVASEAMEFAVGTCFERESVVSERELLTAAMRRSLGSVPISMFEEQLKRAPRFIRRELDGVMMVTTKEVMAEEERMIAFAKAGRGTQLPLARNHIIKDKRLNEQQRAAAMHVLNSTDRVVIIRGIPGTGKTTLMTETVDAIKGLDLGRLLNKDSVTLLAPSADASRGVLRSEGFKNADTVAKFLQDEKRQERAKGGVIWVDEAGLLGSKTMAALCRVAEQLNARLVLSGDPAQHGSVERGSPLKVFEKYAGVQPLVISNILRQRGLYKSAVEHLANGDAAKGFAGLEKLGCIREMDEAEAHRHIASDFATTLERGRSAHVISPTHAEGRSLTGAIRDELKRRGMVKGKGQLFDRLEDLQLTEIEKRQPDQYEKGLVIQFHQNVGGFKAGQKYTVTGYTPGVGVMTSNLHVLPLSEASKFNVYRRHEKSTELCIGDRIRITANGKTAGNPENPLREFRPHAVNNGAVYRVKDFSGKTIVLENGWVLSGDFGHFTHGYCTTSQAAQGKTADVVFVAQSANSFGATSLKQFLVSVSRGKHECVVYTDDKEGLRRRIEQTADPRAAVELSAKRFEAEQRERNAVEIARRFEEHKASQWRTMQGPEKSAHQPERGYDLGR